MTDRSIGFNIQRRRWQVEATGLYHRRGAKNFVVDVVPGGGKTIFALGIQNDLLEDKVVKKSLIVTHTDHLRNQWIAQAARVGLRLIPHRAQKWGDEHGRVLTYQQIAQDARGIAALVRGAMTMVVFDEIHHVSDNATWGNAVGKAFAAAERRLLLSGTPFRHDERKIAYVSYEGNRALVDYQYTYKQALDDGVVAPIFFPTIGGTVLWQRDGKQIEHSFDSELNLAESAARLDSVISAKSDWLATVIGEADRRLDELRAVQHKDAGGLVVCKDQAHARAVAKLIQKLTGEPATLAISDVTDSSARLQEFTHSTKKWLVAVKMVTEGVDIPRLRVGVYATNVTTELFFRQMVGRLIRTLPNLQDQSVFLFIPRDPLIIRYAQEIDQERVHMLEERLASRRAAAAGNGQQTSAPELELLGAQAVLGETLFGNEVFSREELEQANHLKHSIGLGYLPDEVVAKILRAFTAAPPPAPAAAPKTNTAWEIR